MKNINVANKLAATSKTQKMLASFVDSYKPIVPYPAYYYTLPEEPRRQFEAYFPKYEKHYQYTAMVNAAKANILSKIAALEEYDLYFEYGEKMKKAYECVGRRLQIDRSEEQIQLSKTVSPEKLKESLTSRFKYKKEERYREAASLLKICFFLARDFARSRIKDGFESKDAYCCFTDQSLLLMKTRYGISMTKRTMYRMIQTLTEAGFIVPNTYVDKKTLEIRKNYRYDSVNSKASYATAYRVCMGAIWNMLGDELVKDLEDKQKNKELYDLVRQIKERDVFSEEEGISKLSKADKEALDSVYDSDKKMLKTEKKIMHADIFFSKRLYDATAYAIRAIRKDLPKGASIRSSEKFHKIFSLFETDYRVKDVNDKLAQKILRVVFDWETHGVSTIAYHLIDEYNEMVDKIGQKRMKLKATDRGISTRIWSECCMTSEADKTRDLFIRDCQIDWHQDVHAMIPNLSKFLEAGGEFRQDDLYIDMMNEVYKSCGQHITRKEMKLTFLRAKFTKTLKKFLANMKFCYADEVAQDELNASYEHLKCMNIDKELRYILDKEWDNTADGKQKLALWTGIYNSVHAICGRSSSSRVFFWESLLELIVCLQNSRQGNLCYNIYDEFFAEKPIDLDSSLKLASEIVYEAYNGNYEPLRIFYQDGIK